MLYPSVTISLLLLFILLQSDHEGELIRSRQEIYQLAMHDNLTGLLNRQAFFDFIAAMGEQGRLGVLFCDANALKYTNDTFGHEAGDELLRKVTACLKEIFSTDVVFRLSGDEFVVLLPDPDEKEMKAQEARLRSVLKAGAFPIASLGTAIGAKSEIKTLMDLAEKNMYVEKEAFYRDYARYCR